MFCRARRRDGKRQPNFSLKEMEVLSGWQKSIKQSKIVYFFFLSQGWHFPKYFPKFFLSFENWQSFLSRC